MNKMLQDSNQAIQSLEVLLEKWTSTSQGRRSFLLSVPLILSACAASTKTRYREGDNTGQETSLSVQDEKRMTEELLPKLQKEYPALQESSVQSYISNLGQNIVSSNSLQSNPYTYRFSVVAVPYVNAFALPAGTIFVTAPLIDMADTEAELAGVVGHEIGHVQARHAAERIDKAEREKGKTLLSGALGGLLGGAAGFGLGKLLCPPRDNKCLAQATSLGALGGAGAGLLVRKFQFMANSREDEMEADRIGFRTATKAGFSKEHVGLFYEKLLKMEERREKGNLPFVASLADAMSTHPPSRERVNQMNELVASSSVLNGKTTSREFENVKDFCSSWTKKNVKS